MIMKSPKSMFWMHNYSGITDKVKIPSIGTDGNYYRCPSFYNFYGIKSKEKINCKGLYHTCSYHDIACIFI